LAACELVIFKLLEFCLFLAYFRYFSSLFFSLQFFFTVRTFFFYVMHIAAMLKFFGLSCDIILSLFFTKVLCTAVILLNFYCPNKNIFGIFFLGKIFVGCFCRIMSVGSPPHRVIQRLEEDRAAFQAKIMDHTVIA
jgi:hypothetical protein